MKAFKMVDAQHADAFECADQIKIDTFTSYQSMDSARADPSEGVVTNYVDRHVVRHSSDPGVKDALALLGIRADNCTNMSFTNVTAIMRLPPMYVFCASAEPDFHRAKQLGAALFEIADLTRFASRVQSCMFGKFGRPVVREVIYKSRHGNPFGPDAARPDPFAKDPSFSWENEVRIIWPTIGGVRGPIFRVPRARHLIKRIA